MTLPPPRVEEELDESGARQVRRARERPDQKIADKLLTAKRWINWESVPDRNHPTKIKKIPIDPFTNRSFERDSGWQTDPARWARFAEASAGGRLVAGGLHGGVSLFAFMRITRYADRHG